MVPSEHSNTLPVNRKSDAPPIAPPRHHVNLGTNSQMILKQLSDLQQSYNS